MASPIYTRAGQVNACLGSKPRLRVSSKWTADGPAHLLPAHLESRSGLLTASRVFFRIEFQIHYTQRRCLVGFAGLKEL